MWCLSGDESKTWCQGQSFAVSATGHPTVVKREYCVRAPLSGMNWSKLHWFGGFLASTVEPFEECLLWVTLSGVWTSSENFHLFYRMRESYGERRPLTDAPGHLFLKHELADLATFIQLALLSGWDFYLLPNLDCAVAFVSHDEFFELQTDDREAVDRAKALLPGATVAGGAWPQ